MLFASKTEVGQEKRRWIRRLLQWPKKERTVSDQGGSGGSDKKMVEQLDLGYILETDQPDSRMNQIIMQPGRWCCYY